jgi:hypothetical protein
VAADSAGAVGSVVATVVVASAVATAADLAAVDMRAAVAAMGVAVIGKTRLEKKGPTASAAGLFILAS